MRRAFVTAAVTAVDVAILLALARGVDLPVALADACSVAVASALSWVLHREITFRGNRNVRWVSRPHAFALVAIAAGAVDVVLTSVYAASLSLALAKPLGIVVAGAFRVVAYRGVLSSDVRRHLGQQRADRPVPPGGPRLTVVVPAKDEAVRIGTTVTRLRAELADVEPEVLVVDDGSSDGTADAAARAGARVLRHDLNRGKGAALRSGMLAASGRTIAFLDADLAYPPAQARVLLDAVESGWDVAVGNRFDPASVVEGQTTWRYVFGRLFNAVTAAVLLGQYRDTQCGCKAFRSDVAHSLFTRTCLEGFAIDVELLHLVELDRLSLVEVPVTLHETSGSTVNLSRSLAALRDIFRVRRWSRQGVYEGRPLRQQR